MHTAAQYGQQEFVRQMLVKVPATITTEQPRPDANNPLLSVNAEVNLSTWIAAIPVQKISSVFVYVFSLKMNESWACGRDLNLFPADPYYDGAQNETVTKLCIFLRLFNSVGVSASWIIQNLWMNFREIVGVLSLVTGNQ